MNNYETVFILNPVLSDDQIEEAVKKYENLISKLKAKIIVKENWGLKKFAYPIQNKKSVYLIDLKYVGIFEIENLTDDIREPYLLVECPRLIFPFARRIIYDLHADGGLPPLLLDPVNFAQLYRQKKEAKEESIN